MDTTLNERIKSAAERLSRSSKTIALTGAGISKESGIPTFRDNDGLWKKYRPEELASREGFLSNPPLVWRWYRQRLLAAGQKEPNPGHLALAEMEDLLPAFLLITQNVDNLHRRAGSRELVELHGNINRYRCFDNAHPVENDPGWGDEPPRCHCGSLIRPDVVWFGEPLPAAELECAFNESATCDTFIVVGTSGLVQPASLLPSVASRGGATVIAVNVSCTEHTREADIFLQGKAGEILPALVDELKDLLGSRDVI